MRFAVLTLLTCLLWLPGHSVESLVVADVINDPQRQLYYSDDTLPQTVQQLIESDIPTRDFLAQFADTKNGLLQFNITLMLGKRISRGLVPFAEQGPLLSFFTACLHHAHPWVRAEAVYTLGFTQGIEALPQIRELIADPSELVAYHAIVTYLQLAGVMPELTAAQLAVFKRVHGLLQSGEANVLADLEAAQLASSLGE